MPRQKSKETLFNELVDIVDKLNVFSLGGRFNEEEAQLYDHKGDGIGHGELALRTRIRNIVGSRFNETNFGEKKYLDLHDVDVMCLPVLNIPLYGGQDIKACVNEQFRDEGSHDAVGRLKLKLGRMLEKEDTIQYLRKQQHLLISKDPGTLHSLYSTTRLEDLMCSTLSAKNVKLIEQISVDFATLIKNTLSASNLTKRYPEGIQVVNRHGHLGVPTYDYVYAFEFTGIAKGVAKYRLTRSYIEKRIGETLALVTQNIPNCIAVDSVGHHPDETLPIIPV